AGAQGAEERPRRQGFPHRDGVQPDRRPPVTAQPRRAPAQPLAKVAQVFPLAESRIGEVREEREEGEPEQKAVKEVHNQASGARCEVRGRSRESMPATAHPTPGSYFALSMYRPSVVSTRMRSPCLMKGGTWIVIPVSSLAGLLTLLTVAPLSSGSVSITLNSTTAGISMPIGWFSKNSTWMMVSGSRYPTMSPSASASSPICS